MKHHDKKKKGNKTITTSHKSQKSDNSGGGEGGGAVVFGKIRFQKWYHTALLRVAIHGCSRPARSAAEARAVLITCGLHDEGHWKRTLVDKKHAE